MATLLARIGRTAFRHRRTVLAGWLVALAAVIAAATLAGGQFDDQFSIPGSPSQAALEKMATEFPGAGGASAQVVFVAPEGHTLDEQQYSAAITSALQDAATAPQVGNVVTPQQTGAVTADKTTALASVQYPVQRAQLDDGTLDALDAALQPARDAGVQVEVGGSAYGNEPEGISATELIGLAVALTVLLVTFGSLAAAGMPILTALVGVGIGVTALTALAAVATISTTAPTLALMIGLAVGIDYALFILSRHRSQLASGTDPEESAARAVGTAGSAVVFAGLTVVIALVGLTVVGIPFLTVMGLSAALTVAVAVSVAVLLLPALLGFAGARLTPRPGSRAARREQRDGDGGGASWSRLVTRRPVLTLLAGTAALVALAVPAAGLHLALPDNSSAPAGSPQRAAYELIADSFGPGVNGPLLVLADTTGQSDAQGAADTLQSQLTAVDGVARVGPAQLSADGNAALLTVVPSTDPKDPATAQLVTELRGSDTAIPIGVTGITAVGIDVSEQLAGALVPFALVVVGLSVLLLMLVFRSIAVPVKATVGYLLSVAAALGATTLVFGDGWLAGLFAVAAPGPVVSFLPIIVMAVLFGLAMDYEVFLVSRMREEYLHTGDPHAAVTRGAGHATRVVTAAALIMATVFASFVFSDNSTVAPIAFALTTGVLLDAFVVRLTLGPAVLRLLGHRAWWLPRWLDRLLPDLDIEGSRLDAPAATAEPVRDLAPSAAP